MSNAVRKVGKGFFWLTVITSLVYSIAMLNTKPAHADDSCTPVECNALRQHGNTTCGAFGLGTLQSVVCPDPNWPDFGDLYCSDGILSLECGND